MKGGRLLLWLIAAAMFACLHAHNVYLYRNDGDFNAFASGDSLRVSHALSDSDTIVSFDSIRVPLTAIDSIVVRRADVPVLRFTFPGDSAAEWVTEKDVYIDAILSIDGHGTVESVDSLPLKVKGRGNTTWTFPKKPMRLKFDTKTSICGFTKAKSYALLADFVDQSMMRNAAAMKLAQMMEVPYSNHFMPCHVYVNGHYAGAYLLTEKISISKASVNIDDSLGVLMEISTEYDELYQFRSSTYNLPVMIKDPDIDEQANDNPDGPCAWDIFTAWQSDYNIAEAKVADLQAAEAFDIRSFVDYLIVYQVALNSELSHPKSLYISKECRDSLYRFGPVWDFDAAFNCVLVNANGVRMEMKPTFTPGLHPMLLRIAACPEFMPLYLERFDYFEYNVLPAFWEWYDAYAAFIEPLARLNGQRWPEPFDGGWIVRDESTFDNVKHIAELRQFITDRVAYLRILANHNRFR